MGVDIVSIITSIFSIQNILISILGVFTGILFGALPGFTGSMGIAVMLPFTYNMPPTTALILLGSLFCGSMYGGSISSILINTPGTPAAACTVLDGHPMAKNGRAGEALRESITASFIGGILGVTALLFLSPPLAKVSLMFGPPEYLLMAIFGLTIIASISEKSMIKGFLSGILGLTVAMIGTDPTLGVPRFIFGLSELIDGIELIPALIGLFALPEVLNIIHTYSKDEVPTELPNIKDIKIGFPTIKHIIKFMPIYLRSSLIGIFIGILPGAGSSIATFLSYNETKKASKHPELFGTGIPEGVAAAESSNNALAGGALIPMLTLGVPGDAVAAIIMGGLMIIGLQPGGELFTTNANIVYTFIIALYLANVIMLLFGIYCAPYFTLVANVPKHMLAAFIVLFTVLGSYALRNSMFDVYVMVLFGIIGYFLKSNGFDVVPMVLGIILGTMAENGFNQSLAISESSNIFVYIFTRPISIILILLTVFSIMVPIIRRHKKKNTAHSAIS